MTRTVLVSALLVLQSAAVGGAVLHMLGLPSSVRRENGDAFLTWFFAITIGLTVDIAALFALGIAGWLTPAAVFVAAVVLLAAALPSVVGLVRDSVARGVRLVGLVELLSVLLLFGSAILAAQHAPGHWDDTEYHLPVARLYIEHHGIVFNEFLRYPLSPLNMNLIFALGLMLGNATTAQTFATLPLFVIGIGLLGVSRRLTGSALVGGLATFSLLGIDPVVRTLGYAYVDNGLAMFCWGATVAVALAATEPDEPTALRWAIVAGILGGASAGTKYFGGVFAVMLALGLLVVRRSWKATAAFCLVVLLFGSWWYVRNVVISGDPVHPLGGHYFGYFVWNAEDLAGQTQDQLSRGVARDLRFFWKGLELAGVTLWALALVGLVLGRATRLVRLFQLMFVSYLFVWFFFAQVDRYLAPVYVVASFLSVYALYQVAGWIGAVVRRRPTWLDNRAIGAAVLLLVFAADLRTRSEDARKNAETWDRSLGGRAGYALLHEADRLRPEFGDRIVQIGFENGGYFFDGTVIGDWFGTARYSEMVQCPMGVCQPLPADRMKAIMARFGSRMLAVSTERYPSFDPNSYAGTMELVRRTRDGALFVVK